MKNKKVIFAIILFLLIGLTIFTFANPSSNEKTFDEEQKEIQDGDDNTKDDTNTTIEEDNGESDITTNDNNTNEVPNNIMVGNQNQNVTIVRDQITTNAQNNNDNYNNALAAVVKAEGTITQSDVDVARDLVGKLDDGDEKSNLENRLEQVQDIIDVSGLVATLEGKTNSAKSRDDILAARSYRDVEQKIKEKVESLKESKEKDDLESRLNDLSSRIDDNTAPEITGVDNNSYINAAVKLTLDGEDYAVTVNDTEYTDELNFSEDGTYTVKVTDSAFNETTVTFTIDTVKPTFKNIKNGSYLNVESLKVEVEDANPDKITSYGKEIDDPVLTEEGIYYLVATDKAGNTSDGVYVAIDRTAPIFKNVKNGHIYDETKTLEIEDLRLKEVKVYNYVSKETTTYTFQELLNGTKVELTSDATYKIIATDFAGHNSQVYVTIDTKLVIDDARIYNTNSSKRQLAKIGDTVRFEIYTKDNLKSEPVLTIDGIKLETNTLSKKTTKDGEVYYRLDVVIPEDNSLAQGEDIKFSISVEDKASHKALITNENINGYAKEGSKLTYVKYDNEPITVTYLHGFVSDYPNYYNTSKDKFAKVGDNVQLVIHSKEAFAGKPQLYVDGKYVTDFEQNSDANGEKVYSCLYKIPANVTDGETLKYEIRNLSDKAGNGIKFKEYTGDVLTNENANEIVFDITSPTAEIFQATGVTTRQILPDENNVYKHTNQMWANIIETNKWTAKIVGIDGKDYELTRDEGRNLDNVITRSGTLVITDEAGNKTEMKVLVDKKAPIIKLNNERATDLTKKYGDVYFNKDTEKVVIDIEEENSYTLSVKKDGEVIENFKSGDSVTEEGVYEIEVTDIVNHVSKIKFTIDRTPATIPYAFLNMYGVSNETTDETTGMRKSYFKNGDSFSVGINFSEELKETPTLTIGGREVELTRNNGEKNAVQYVGTFSIPADEKELEEGLLDVILSNVKDLAGNVQDDETVLNQTNLNMRQAYYDRTKPTFTSTLFDADTNEPITGNVTNAKRIKVVIEWSEPITDFKKIDIGVLSYSGWTRDDSVEFEEIEKGKKYAIVFKQEEGAKPTTFAITMLSNAVMDLAGNSSELKWIRIENVDSDAPEVSGTGLHGNEEKTLEEGKAYKKVTLNIEDAHLSSGEVNGKMTIKRVFGSENSVKEESITETTSYEKEFTEQGNYEVTIQDAAGNSVVKKFRVDTGAPMIDCNNSNLCKITIDKGTDPIEAIRLKASDRFTAAPDLKIETGTTKIDTSRIMSYRNVNVTIEDEAGNVLTKKVYDISIVNNGKEIVSMSTASDLAKLYSEPSQYKGKYINLTADIDLNELNSYGSNTNWHSLDSRKLSGLVINGNGHTIKNMKVSDTDSESRVEVFNGYAIGFIGYNNDEDITIKNIKFDNANVQVTNTGSSNVYAGVVIGYIDKATSFNTLDNITVKNSLVNAKNEGGGIVGHIDRGFLTLNSCIVTDTRISGNDRTNAGSFIGGTSYVNETYIYINYSTATNVELHSIQTKESYLVGSQYSKSTLKPSYSYEYNVRNTNETVAKTSINSANAINEDSIEAQTESMEEAKVKEASSQSQKPALNNSITEESTDNTQEVTTSEPNLATAKEKIVTEVFPYLSNNFNKAETDEIYTKDEQVEVEADVEDDAGIIWWAEFSCDMDKCEGFKEHGSDNLSGKVIEGRRGEIRSITMEAPKAKDGYKFIGWKKYEVTYDNTDFAIQGFEAIYDEVKSNEETKQPVLNDIINISLIPKFFYLSN